MDNFRGNRTTKAVAACVALTIVTAVVVLVEALGPSTPSRTLRWTELSLPDTFVTNNNRPTSSVKYVVVPSVDLARDFVESRFRGSVHFRETVPTSDHRIVIDVPVVIYRSPLFGRQIHVEVYKAVILGPASPSAESGDNLVVLPISE